MNEQELGLIAMLEIMSTPDPATGAQAIRLSIEQDLDQSSPSTVTALERIEHLLFERRALAPAETIRLSVIALLRKEDDALLLSNDALLTLHDEFCVRLAADFGMDAGAWDDPITTEYRRRAATAFGIEVTAVTTLFREFHALPESQRLGIFLAIEKSPVFAHLTREIDNYEGDAVLDDPTKSLRGLMATVFSLE